MIESCPYVDIITHPHRRGFPLDPELVAPVAAENGVCLEANNATLALCRCEREVVVNMLSMCRREGYRIAVGSDAHSVSEVGKFTEIIEVLDEVDFPDELIENRTLETTLEWIEERREYKSSSR